MENQVRKEVIDGVEITSQWVKVTPDVARELLSHNESNRPLSKGYVDTLKEEFLKGRFIHNGQSDRLLFDWNGVLRDGQHRLTAILESGCTFYFEVKSGYDPKIFETLDTGRGRNAGQTLALLGCKCYVSIASAITGHFAYNKNFSLVSYRVGMLKNSKRKIKLTNADICDIYKRNKDRWDLLSTKYPSKLKSSQFGNSELYLYCYILLNDLGYSQDKVFSFFDDYMDYNFDNYKSLKPLRKALDNPRLTKDEKLELVSNAWNRRHDDDVQLIRKSSNKENKVRFK